MSPGQLLANAVVLSLLVLSGVADAAKATIPAKRTASPRSKVARASRPQGVDRRSLEKFLFRPWETKLLWAMHELKKNVATSPAAIDEVYVSGETKLSISSDGNDPGLKITTAGQTRPATVEDLRALGITSVAKLQALLREQLRPFFDEWGYVLSHDYEALANTVQTETHRLARHAIDLPRRPDAALLLAHHRVLGAAKNPGEFALFDEGGDDKLVFHVPYANVVLSMFEGDKMRNATVGDLTRLHLGTNAEVDAALARHLVRIADVEGDAKNPMVVTKARKVLHAQIDEHDRFSSLLFDPSSESKDFTKLISLMDSQKLSSLVIRAKGPLSLRIITRQLGYFRFSSTEEKRYEFRLFNKSGEKNIEQLTDLLAVNIPDSTTLKAALAETRAKLEGKRVP